MLALEFKHSIQLNDVTFMKKIVQQQPDILTKKIFNDWSHPALSYSILSDMISDDMTLELMNLTQSFDFIDHNGNSLFHLAAQNGSLHILQALTEKAPIEYAKSVNFSEDTVLHAAVKSNQREKIDQVLKVIDHTTLMMTNKQGETPLDLAIKCKYSTVALHLFDLINKTEYFIHAETATRLLPIALAEEDPSLLANLCKLNAKLETKDERGDTPLHLMIQHRKTDHVTLLLEHNVSTRTENRFHRNTLEHAVFHDWCDIIPTLIAHTPDLDIRDHEGNTLLHRVIEKRIPSNALSLATIIYHYPEAHKHMLNHAGLTAMECLSTISAKRYKSVLRRIKALTKKALRNKPKTRKRKAVDEPRKLSRKKSSDIKKENKGVVSNHPPSRSSVTTKLPVEPKATLAMPFTSLPYVIDLLNLKMPAIPKVQPRSKDAHQEADLLLHFSGQPTDRPDALRQDAASALLRFNIN